MSNNYADLGIKLFTKTAKIGIIGLGYVGSALADLTTTSGLDTIGFVRKSIKAKEINKSKKPYLKATSNISLISKCDVILVCVQTPIYKTKKPNLKYLVNALKSIVPFLRKGQLIVLESSITPGTTRNIAYPILDKTNLIEGKDYFLAFSPERVNPGLETTPLDKIPKVVSGLSSQALSLAESFYKMIMEKVIPVSSLETAEMVKLFENSFRLVNISLVNELLDYANRIGVDMWEIVDAASTKPFGFLPHYPGPGAGGHCIPVDPYYLIDDAKKRNYDLTLIKRAGKINDNQPYKVVKRAVEILETRKLEKISKISRKEHSSYFMAANRFLNYKADNKKNGESRLHYDIKNFKFIKKQKQKVLLLGVAYKANINDVRESPAKVIWKALTKKGYSVNYHDPLISSFNNEKGILLDRHTAGEYDLVIILSNHSNINYETLLKTNVSILDTRHILDSNKNNNVYYL